jgi:hypothetical protein
MFLDRLNYLLAQIENVPHVARLASKPELIITAATLILAEEINKLSTTASALAQATTNLSNVVSQLNTDFNTAWPVIQAALTNPSGTPQADIDNAVAVMGTIGTSLGTVDSDLKSVVPPASNPPTTGLAPAGASSPAQATK